MQDQEIMRVVMFWLVALVWFIATALTTAALFFGFGSVPPHQLDKLINIFIFETGFAFFSLVYSNFGIKRGQSAHAFSEASDEEILTASEPGGSLAQESLTTGDTPREGDLGNANLSGTASHPKLSSTTANAGITNRGFIWSLLQGVLMFLFLIVLVIGILPLAGPKQELQPTYFVMAGVFLFFHILLRLISPLNKSPQDDEVIASLLSLSSRRPVEVLSLTLALFCWVAYEFSSREILTVLGHVSFGVFLGKFINAPGDGKSHAE